MSTLNVTNIKAADGTSGLSVANSTGVVSFANNISANAPAFSAYPSAGASLSGSTFHTMPFNTEEFDSNGKFNTSTYKFTPGVAGFYFVSWHICFPDVNGAYVVTRLMKNSSAFRHGQNGGGVTNIQRITGGNCIIQLNATDSIHVEGFHGAGTTTFPSNHSGIGSMDLQQANNFSAFKMMGL